jgi:hypothetical protein
MNYIRLNKVPKPWGKVAGGGWHHVIQDEKPVAKMYCPECGKEGYLEAELVEDMISLMSSFSARIYGKRSAENARKKREAKQQQCKS